MLNVGRAVGSHEALFKQPVSSEGKIQCDHPRQPKKLNGDWCAFKSNIALSDAAGQSTRDTKMPAAKASMVDLVQAVHVHVK